MTFMSLCILNLFSCCSCTFQPREALRAGEDNTVARLTQCFEDLHCQGILGLGEKKDAENVLGPRRGGIPV